MYDDVVAAALAEFPLPSGADKANCQTDLDDAFPDVLQLVKDISAGD